MRHNLVPCGVYCVRFGHRMKTTRPNLPESIVLLLVFLIAATLGETKSIQSQRPAASTGDQESNLIQDLVYANRILYDQGVLDGFGHVSVRDGKDPSHFLLSRSMAPGLVTTKDILEYDSKGSPIDAAGRAVYLERFIHAAIYRARPDVKAVVHSHSPSLIAFSVTGTSLRPVYHLSSFLGTGAPIFDIREAAGMTDMLVRNNELGDALAKVLADKAVVLMRGHGSVIVGNSVQQVVYRAIYTDIDARLQQDASRLGRVTFLSPEEASKSAATLDAQVPRAWELWKSRIGKIE
jgi:ribulose-5-phosphate 4-epimerase/fuculose-1-phosphate aldolase